MPNVEITIKTIVDKAIADLKKTAGAVDDVDNSAQKGKGGISDFSGAMLGLNAALEIGNKVMQTAKMVHDQTVGVFIDYAAQVRDMSRATGESAEESSRMIQMADDMGVSYDKLKVSLQMAARQGIDISVESLKGLSEEYLTLAPGTERMQFLLDNFGRSGAEMGRLLELGADGLDALNASIDGGLVLTEEILNQARAHEILVDTLNDEIEAQKVLAGIRVGGLEDEVLLTMAINARLDAMMQEKAITEGGNMTLAARTQFYAQNYDAVKAQIQAEIDAKIVSGETAAATDELAESQGDLADANKNVVSNIQALNSTLPLAVTNLESVRAKAGELITQLQRLKDLSPIKIDVDYRIVVSGDTPPGNP